MRPDHATDIFCSSVLVILFGQPLLAEDSAIRQASNASACRQSEIRFDITSLETVILRPETILKDVDAFWREDGAYKLMSVWHETNDQPRNVEDWTRRINTYAQVPVEERSSNPLLALGREFKRGEAAFNDKAIAHICSFLPAGIKPLETTVYFAAEQQTSGIAVRRNIVLNIRTQEALNMIVHEAYHVGFNSARGNPGPVDREVDPVGWIAIGLQNEGMATYVAFRASDMFPAPGMEDYPLLVDPAARVRLCRRLNSLLAKAKSYSPDRLQSTAWRIGVLERAYYIVGAFMAQTIDEKLGRQALVQTISEGPRAFIHKYNALAPQDMKIVEPQSS
ncbi:MAG: hypothetical protein JSU63_06370 [Phycisphaerales bacterium]|nr:MAG: hypothetical protein JSU63_06370 [Phycisphaerales bacterium]